MATGPKERIAVLGGGVGALSAAFYLTELPDWSDRYEITVYQQGWRLGGKCASGHDTRPGYGDRIVEHGLHIFAGFYDRAFDLLRRAYDVLERPKDHPNRTVWDSFTPDDLITIVDPLDTVTKDQLWFLDYMPNDEVPGDIQDEVPIAVMVRRMVGWLLHGDSPMLQPPIPARLTPARPPGLIGALEAAWSAATEFLAKAEHEIAEVIDTAILHHIIAYIEAQMLAIRAHDLDADARLRAERYLLLAYFCQTLLWGIIADDVQRTGYDALDKYEWTDWIYQNALAVAKTQNPAWGKPEDRARQLAGWTIMTSMYDYVFGYADGGDVKKPDFGAGTALRAGFLLLSYKGHFFWKMRGAMGDVVIAPLYLALRKRGVRFEFFTRITQLNIDPSVDRLTSIDFVRQARLKDPARGYEPLIGVPVPGWPKDQPLEGWPLFPLWEQLADGERHAAAGRNYEADHRDAPGDDDEPGALRLGEHFDAAIIGISVGGLKQVCATFPARLPQSKWGPMFEKLTVTRTCAMQIWFTRTMDDLGCTGSDRVLAGSDQPYSSWADMSHLLSRETWRGDIVPRSIAYFCGQITGPENGPAANRKAYEDALAWLKASTPTFWAAATSDESPYGLDPALIFDPNPGAPGDVLTRQYIAANTNPSDLYVQSPAGSVFTRMDADQSGLDNLFLAGDWTLNGLNAGAAEAAARSGWRAAQAIGGVLPPLPL